MLKNLLYIPLSWLYAVGVALRHWLYDNHLLPSYSVSVPTICVGNLAVGGTGKTPHVEMLVRLLREHGWRVAVLSRGYKRKTHGFVLADERATARTIGDEAMQIHEKFPDVAVAVCESRVHGVHQLQRRIEGLDVVVLDDAMQHRSIRCGLTILLTPYHRLYIDNHLLPWGTLRDLKRRALKADIVIVSKCPDNMQPIDLRVVDNRLHLPTYQHLYFSDLHYAPITASGTPLVVCGIAQPSYLEEHIRSLYPNAEMMLFADHHSYRDKDLQAILNRARYFDFVLTTEKDAQRLRLTPLGQQLAEMGKQLVTLPIEVRLIRDPEGFARQVLTYVSERRRLSNDQ